MIARLTFALATCSAVLLFTTGCDKATAVTQAAKRAVDVAKSLDEDGNSSDPKLQALQASVQSACDKLLTCTKEAEKENDDNNPHAVETYEAIEEICKNSKYIVIHASIAGKSCTEALTAQFNCYAQNDCSTGEEQNPCADKQAYAEKECTEFFEKFND